jgi:hypothetical protein
MVVGRTSQCPRDSELASALRQAAGDEVGKPCVLGDRRVRRGGVEWNADAGFTEMQAFGGLCGCARDVWQPIDLIGTDVGGAWHVDMDVAAVGELPGARSPATFLGSVTGAASSRSLPSPSECRTGVRRTAARRRRCARATSSAGPTETVWDFTLACRRAGRAILRAVIDSRSGSGGRRRRTENGESIRRKGVRRR